jgi:hypothetical protein
MRENLQQEGNIFASDPKGESGGASYPASFQRVGLDKYKISAVLKK